MRRLRVAAIVGREAGVRIVRDSLLRHPDLELVAVAAHARLPRSEDPARGPRPEYATLAGICAARGVPLLAVDSADEAADLPFLAPFAPLDLVCSVSWRYRVSADGLGLPRLGCVNLHRGRLPEFGGAEPVRRMIEAGLGEAEIAAHLMVEAIDAGPVLATVRLPFARDPGRDTVSLAEDVKRRLLPLYAPLLDAAIAALRARHGLEDDSR